MNKNLIDKNPILQIAMLNFDNFIGGKRWQNAKEIAPVLSEPLYKFQDISSIIPNISYRMINDWDSKGLLTNHRNDDKKGWRKFSVQDVIRLKLIQDLKSFGMLYPSILNCVTDIFEIGINPKLYLFEFFYLATVAGYKTVIVTTKQGYSALMLEQNYFQSYNHDYNMGEPMLLLPFSSYVLPFVKEKIEFKPIFKILDVVDENTKNNIEEIASEFVSPDFKELSVKKINRHEKSSYILQTQKIETKNLENITKEDLLSTSYKHKKSYKNDDGTITVITNSNKKLS